MTVAELIEELRKLPPDLLVCRFAPDCKLGNVVEIGDVHVVKEGFEPYVPQHVLLM